MSNFAVVMGVTACHADFQALASAQYNAERVAGVLKKTNLGDFDHVDIQINPELGAMQRSIGKTLSQCEPEDLALVYFTGCGFFTAEGEFCLAAADTEPDIPETAVSVTFLRKALDRCMAARQIVILDCYFEPGEIDGLSYRLLQQQLGAQGRIVLMAPSLDRTLWQESTQMSTYTHFLVEGIETGKADRQGSGQINLRDLHAYALEVGQFETLGLAPHILLPSETYNIRLCPAIQQKCVSTTPSRGGGISSLYQDSLDEGVHPCNACKPYMSNASGPQFSTVDKENSPFVSLSNVLMPFVSYIERFILALEHHGAFSQEERSAQAWYALKLAVLQQVLGAENVVHWQGDVAENVYPSLQSNLAVENDSDVLMSIFKMGGTARIFAPDSCGVRLSGVRLPESSGGVVLVPVESDSNVIFLALHGLPMDFLQEPLACLISKLYQLDHESLRDAINVEGQLIDAWKCRFQFMPSNLYDRRFALFCQRLKQMQVFFQPIVQLRPLALSGWEALARDRENHKTPVELFHVAELWGKRFIIELDLHFLRVATLTYRDQTERYGITPLPLSINVYPDSLLQKVYMDTLQELSMKGMISSGSIVLEISEKREIVYMPTLSNRSPVNQSFRRKLKEIAQRIPHIRFAIDDYGSNHATVSRLLGLCLNYVKIDREVLFSEPDIFRTVLKFIRALMIEQGLFQSCIVMEGIDQDCPMTLGELSSLGVSHIQGFWVGAPEEWIYADLSPELREDLSEQLRFPVVSVLPTF